MYLTSTDYERITGREAPQDFAALCQAAQGAVDARTLYGYAGREGLPAPIRDALQRAVAYEAARLQGLGGIAGATDAETGGSLGSYATGGQPQSRGRLNPLTERLLPLLIGYLRGVGL